MQHGKMVWGQEASKAKQWFHNYEAKKLLRKPRNEEDKAEQKRAPGVLTDPQGHIIRTRVRRFQGDITRVTQHVVQNRLSRDNYLMYVIREVEKLIRSMAAMSSLRLDPVQVRQICRDVRDDVARMLQPYSGRLPLGMVNDLVQNIIKGVENRLASRRDQPDTVKAEEKISHSSQKGLSEYAPLLENKIRALGLDAKDLPGLIATARSMGVPVDKIMADLEKDGESEDLNKLLGG